MINFSRKPGGRVLNWGLLSTARINQALIPPLRQSKRNRLTTVASRSMERAKQYGRDWNIPNALGSYEALIADPEIDVIYNPLPNHLHAEWTIKAALAGKHVLCEKPLALSLEEVDSISAAAQKGGVVVMEAFMYRHHPQTLRIKELIGAGQLGDIKILRGSFTFPLDRKDDIRWKPEWGGGSLWDVGCYPVSYSMMITGTAPEEVMGWQIQSSTGVDLTFTGQMRFPNGVLAQFDSSFGLPDRTFMDIQGTEGGIYIPTPFLPDQRQKVVLRKGNREQNLFFDKISPYLCEVEEMSAIIIDGKAPRLTLAESRLHIATLSALLQSARTGKSIRL
jgi:D-xylose 1-dehydrogenase (NADP+, D-xylono-1,5-lactone-forming)